MSRLRSYSILDSVAANGADIKVIDGNLKITGAPIINMGDVRKGVLVDPLTEALRVVTITPTTASGVQTYAIRIKQRVGSLGTVISKPFSYTAASGDNATTICNAFRAAIALDRELSLTAGGTSTLTLTAKTGSPEITVALVSLGSGLTQASTAVNTSGTAMTITGTTVTVSSNVATAATGTVAGFADGHKIRLTLTGSDSITFRDGRTALVGDIVDVRVGSVSGTGLVISAGTDATISAIAALASATVNAGVPVVQPARGNYVSLSGQGITGLTSGNIYSEIAIDYLEPGSEGGALQSKSHSVYVNTSDSDYSSGSPAMRALILDTLGGVNSGATTANPEVNAVG